MSNDERPLHDDDTADEDDAKISIDPSIIVPDGISRRIRKSTLDAPPDVKIVRPAMTIAKKHDKFQYQKPQSPKFKEVVKNSMRKKTECSRKRLKDTLYLRLPILQWLLHYKVRNDLLNDVISGVTVAVMNIPQGMAYAMLAGLEPVYGIYMAFYPVLVYATLATSRHCSMGTFAVVCIMTGQVISDFATPTDVPDVGLLDPDVVTYSPIEVATILSFACSIWMIIFALLNLGSLSVFLSDMLVSGFTTGAAVHVLTSQVPKLFGLEFPSYQGVFKIPKTWYAIFTHILDSNSATMVISIICLFILVLNNEVLKPRLRKKSRIPFPIEMVVVILGSVTSHYGHLESRYNVQVVGNITTGLPGPVVPPFDLYGSILIPSLTISIVAFSVSFSMAKIFAKKLDYQVDATQELYAMGLGNLMGSFFSCAPIAASLSRSVVQQTVGGATQLASYISCLLLSFVLLFIGPYFRDLPTSVLAAIIAVALKGMFLQFSDLTTMWKVSRSDAAVWLITFLSVVILDIDYGLLIGIMTALLLLIVRNQVFKICLLGRVADTDIYLDKSRYPLVKEVPGIKICHVMGSLHFANRESFTETLKKASGIDPKLILKWKRKQQKLAQKTLNNDPANKDSKLNSAKEIKTTSSFQMNEMNKNSFENKTPASYLNRSIEKLKSSNIEASNPVPEIASLIVDFSGVSQIDIAASKNLSVIRNEYHSAEVVLIYTGISEPGLEAMKKCNILSQFPEEVLFHTVPDAVAFLTAPETSPNDVVLHL